jgi:zinc protease
MKLQYRVLLFLMLFGLSNLLSAKTPTIERWQTNEGMTVLFMQEKSVPMVDVAISFWAGSAFDDLHPGVAALSNELITKGAGPYSEQVFSEALESLGAQLSNDVSKDLASFQIRTLSQASTLKQSLKLFSLMLTKPRLTEEAFELLKVQQKHAVKLAQQSPAKVADLEIFKLLYGVHPYAHPLLGSEESLDKLSLQDCKTFFNTYYVAPNTTLAIVGDLTLKEAKFYAETLSKALPNRKPNTTIPTASLPEKAQTHHLPFQSSQTAIRIGQIAIDYKSQHYFPLLVGNYTLGGSGLTSQLAYEVREKRGLSYGVYSYFQRLQQNGPFMISLATKNQSANAALNITEETFSRFLNSGPTEAEMTMAKQYLSGSFPIQLSSNRKIVAILQRMGAYQLPNDYLETYLTNIEKVRRTEIKKAFNQVLNPEKMVTLTVGSRS